MLTALGLALSFGGAATAFAALSKLRAETCPSCDAVGAFALVGLEMDDCPSRDPLFTRSRRCAVCGCTVIDRRSLSHRPRWPRLAALAR